MVVYTVCIPMRNIRNKTAQIDLKSHYAFQNAKYLTSLTYAGAQSEWDAMTKGSGWNSGVHANFAVTCTGVEPEPEVDPETEAE